MKIYRLSTLEEYKNFVRDASESDQPLFVYTHPFNPHLALLSQKEIIDPEAEMNKLAVEKDDIMDDEQGLFDDDDFDDPLLLIL